MTAARTFLTGKQVVFLASIDWNQAWQRHQALAQAFAAQGAEVFFVENTGFRGIRPRDAARVVGRLKRLFAHKPKARTAVPTGVTLISPAVLPPTLPAFRALNQRSLVPKLAAKLAAAGLKPGCVAFAYLPTATTVALLGELDPATVVYDCVDNFHGHPTPPSDLDRTEAALLERAALVLATSPTLRADLEGKHDRVREIHHGVSPAFLAEDPSPRDAYDRFAYFGTVWNVLDYAPVRALVEAGKRVDLIGPVKESPPALPDGARLLDPLPHAELPKALEAYDALLLPYADVPYNKGVLPAKIFECLATGKPVLSAPLPALEPVRDLLYVCESPAAFAETADRLSETETPERVAERVAAARAKTTPAQAALIADEVRAAAEAA